MKRITDVKAVIRHRLAELKLRDPTVSERWLSRQLEKNPSYINDYLQPDGSPQDLPYETKLKVADVLSLKPQDLGIAPITERGTLAGFADDAVAYDEGRPKYLASAPNIAYFQMRSYALDQHELRIKPGDILTFDLNKVKVSEIKPGQIVVAQRYDKKQLTGSHGTIIRQFIPPNKLITNSSIANEIDSMDDLSLPYEIVIKGALLAVVQAMPAQNGLTAGHQ